MSMRLPSTAPASNDPDIDVGALLREVGADSVALHRHAECRRDGSAERQKLPNCSVHIRSQELHQHARKMTILGLCCLVENLR